MAPVRGRYLKGWGIVVACWQVCLRLVFVQSAFGADACGAVLGAGAPTARHGQSVTWPGLRGGRYLGGRQNHGPSGLAQLREQPAGPNDVIVSSTMRDLVIGSGLEFEDRGAHQLEGVPGEWRLFAVAST